MKTVDETSLIYEQIDGMPIYYKGYQRIFYTNDTLEDIMGSSASQAMVVSIILRYLYATLDESCYEILTNEIGFHLSKNTNLSADIAIMDSDSPALDVESVQYIAKAPKVVIEVDLKADVSSFASPMDYYHKKNSKLLDFGVEKIIWVNTVSKVIMSSEDFLKSMPWDTSIEILPGVVLNVGKLVEDSIAKKRNK